jgi:hypothetical protein
MEKNTKILVGGIADGKAAIKLLGDLEKVEDKTFDEHIIAYIDFLGIKKIMGDTCKSYDFLQIIQFLLKGTENVANLIHSVNQIKPFDIKIFSDNIVISQRINEDVAGDQIIGILNLIWSLQYWALIQFGLFLRGGITIGELYMDENIVWGTGLIEAYNLENNLANYPRVLVSKSVIDKYDMYREKTLNIQAFIDKDLDGMWFVDYMMACVNIKSMPNASESIKDTVKSYVKADERIKQKINWTIRYFNDHCLKLKDRIDFNQCIIEYI